MAPCGSLWLLVAPCGSYTLKTNIWLIIENRNNQHGNYTFDDIAKLPKEDFSITISEQGVGKSYRKYIDNQNLQKM
ncbi:hypothetical protein [Psychrobacter urativorans]|uniref:hypothetical protein n=1 Tax=Psychrobacter urativorans TaxID=45610 RepID=UPI0019183D08|nr:hypothetical protein [Psychrobacter urativorans]